MPEQKRKKRTLFEREADILKGAQEASEKPGLSADDYKGQLKDLVHHYEELLDQSKLITKVSDRLQKKLNRTNETLEHKNVELVNTLDALTKARVGRRAATITLIIFVVLFLVAEGLIEPVIENKIEETVNDKTYEVTLNLALKGLLALSLRPIERVVERILLKKEAQKKEKEFLKKQAE